MNALQLPVMEVVFIYVHSGVLLNPISTGRCTKPFSDLRTCTQLQTIVIPYRVLITTVSNNPQSKLPQPKGELKDATF